MADSPAKKKQKNNSRFIDLCVESGESGGSGEEHTSDDDDEDDVYELDGIDDTEYADKLSDYYAANNNGSLKFRHHHHGGNSYDEYLDSLKG